MNSFSIDYLLNSCPDKFYNKLKIYTNFLSNTVNYRKITMKVYSPNFCKYSMNECVPIFYYVIDSIHEHDVDFICNKNIEIYFILLNDKKQYNGYFDPNSINSGFTLFKNGYKPSILIYRFEEWTKVFIHELIHALNLDSYHQSNISAPRNINKEWGISEDIHIKIYEAFTEMWAIMLFLNYYYPNNKDAYNLECLWAGMQALKFLKLAKWKDHNDYCINRHKNIITQTTAAFEYYYIKFIMLIYYDKIKHHIKPIIFGEQNLWTLMIPLMDTDYVKNYFKIINLYKFNCKEKEQNMSFTWHGQLLTTLKKNKTNKFYKFIGKSNLKYISEKKKTLNKKTPKHVKKTYTKN